MDWLAKGVSFLQWSLAVCINAVHRTRWSRQSELSGLFVHVLFWLFLSYFWKVRRIWKELGEGKNKVKILCMIKRFWLKRRFIMHVTYLLNIAATIFCLVHAKVEFKSQAWILWCLPQMLCALQCAGTIQIHPLSTPAGLCSGGGASSYISFVLPWASPLLPLVSNGQQITQLEGEHMSIHSFPPSQVTGVW